jgi:hypothetical protein
MNRSSSARVPARPQPAQAKKRQSTAVEGQSDGRANGVSRWRALEGEQFRALIASPSVQNRREGVRSW